MRSRAGPEDPEDLKGPEDPGDPGDPEGFARTVEAASRRLVALDNEPGGVPAGAAPVAVTAARVWAGVRPGLPGADRQGAAAAAELAGVTGWLLFDAERHAAARRASRAALDLARRSGDRPIELLTLQNMALADAWLGRHRRALARADAVLDTFRLPPRVEAVFRLRAAAGGATSWSAGETDRAFARGRALLAWGGRRPDPPWTWWLTAGELDGQRGGLHQEAGEWRAAVPPLRRAAEGGTAGYRGLFAVRLLRCLLELRAWREAAEVAAALLPALPRTGSARTRRLLAAALRRGGQLPGVPGELRELLRHMRATAETATTGAHPGSRLEPHIGVPRVQPPGLSRESHFT
jgi:tetratricopeptide (TPR) repeat protein